MTIKLEDLLLESAERGKIDSRQSILQDRSLNNSIYLVENDSKRIVEANSLLFKNFPLHILNDSVNNKIPRA